LLLFRAASFHLLYILVTVAFWLVYVLLRFKANPRVLDDWGFTSRGLRVVAIRFGPPAAAALMACVLWGVFRGTARWNSRLLGLLLLYPLWGLVQQFLVTALLARNLTVWWSGTAGRAAAAATAILLFGMVHLPSMPLMALGLVLGLYCTLTYLQTQNLWLLGLFHGWFATLVYVFVLEQDPWTDVVSAALVRGGL
jgi:hypothetical protein